MNRWLRCLLVAACAVPCAAGADEDAFATREIGSKRQAVLLSALFPGIGQLSRGRNITGAVLAVSELGALATALTANENYKTRLDNFDRQKSEYEAMAAGNSRYDVAQQRWQQLGRDADDLDGLHRTRQVFTAIAVGVYVYSLVDVVLHDPPRRPTAATWQLQAVPAVGQAPARLMMAGRF